MKRITHNADNRRRQVVPGDFSFLSDADSDVVSALFYAVAAMFGFGQNDAVVLTGCRLSKRETAGHRYYKLGDGLILKNGTVYTVRGVPAFEVEEFPGSMNVMRLVLENRWLVFGSSNVAPSPVYEYGEGQVYCHEDTVATEVSDTPMAADCVRLSDLKVLPVIGRSLEYLSYVRAASLELAGQNEED